MIEVLYDFNEFLEKSGAPKLCRSHYDLRIETFRTSGLIGYLLKLKIYSKLGDDLIIYETARTVDPFEIGEENIKTELEKVKSEIMKLVEKVKATPGRWEVCSWGQMCIYSGTE